MCHIQFDTEDEGDQIKFWHCLCKSGARLVGCCANGPFALEYWHSETQQNPFKPSSNA